MARINTSVNVDMCKEKSLGAALQRVALPAGQVRAQETFELLISIGPDICGHRARIRVQLLEEDKRFAVKAQFHLQPAPSGIPVGLRVDIKYRGLEVSDGIQR